MAHTIHGPVRGATENEYVVVDPHGDEAGRFPYDPGRAEQRLLAYNAAHDHADRLDGEEPR